MYRRRSKKQKHEETMWGLVFGSIMLLAVSVSVSSCDTGASPSGQTFNVSSGITATGSSGRTWNYFSGNKNVAHAQTRAARELGITGYSIRNERDSYMSNAYSR